MKQVIDQAIVLRRTNYGERDRIVSVLGLRHGKISVFAKGVRSPKSKLNAAIELLNVSEIGFMEGRGELKTLISARLINHYQKITEDLQRTNQIFEALRMIDKLSDEGGGQEYFHILRLYMVYLSDDLYDKRLVEAWFWLQIMKAAGVLGHIEVQGEREREAKYKFDINNQVFTAANEGAFTLNDIKLLRLLSQQKKPLRLQSQTGSEDQLVGFSKDLVKSNLS